MLIVIHRHGLNYGLDKAAEILADICARETSVHPSLTTSESTAQDSNTWLLKANVTGTSILGLQSPPYLVYLHLEQSSDMRIVPQNKN